MRVSLPKSESHLVFCFLEDKLVSTRIRRYRGPKGKIVEYVQINFDEDYRSVCIQFKDKTCFVLTMRVDVSPHIVGLYDVKTGDSKVIREYVLPKAFR